MVTVANQSTIIIEGSIDRFIVPSQLDRSTLKAELHMSSDASEIAYGSAVYLKYTTIKDTVSIALL
ncbi:hypothetical protein DPMN_041166 [Dreissena polymorpha]|uniref:Uncharacterized protein n=1 Tax=Dreissena polymorpha TaxID=45954 RepID=A0A9D4CYV6_DREPO|nr:hypothetical protein DPMN_041166 [Dreissena polymorpha]